MLSPSQKTQALDLFQVPATFRAAALKMLSTQELELILLMEQKIWPEQELMDAIQKNGIADSPAVLICTAYERAVLNKKRAEDNALCWQIADFYTRYPHYAQYEPEEYLKLPRETIQALNQWDFEVYYGVYGEDVKKKMQGINTYVHNSTFLTLEESDALIEKHKDHIYLVPCNCKCMMDATAKPRYVCLKFDSGDNSECDRGRGEPLTMERAKELVRYWNSCGLMQNGEDYAICNCDGESCYPLQMARRAGSQGSYPKSRYAIQWNPELCVQCGKCAKVCNFQAFRRDADGKVTFHPDLCWGCTICSANCPRHAISLLPREEDN